MPAPFSLRACVGFVACLAAISVDAAIVSHPPMRALPTASNRAQADGPAKFVDAAKGNDANDGGEATPSKLVTKIPKRTTQYSSRADTKASGMRFMR